jgi:hypothetical protein
MRDSFRCASCASATKGTSSVSGSEKVPCRVALASTPGLPLTRLGAK